MSEIRKKTIEGLKVGDAFTASRTFDEQSVQEFSNITENHNPVYSDEKFVRAKNLIGKVCPGLLVGSLVTEIGGQNGWLASKLDLRFKKPVYVGDTVTCSLTISCVASEGLTEAKAVCRNQQGEIVLEAFLKGYIPIGDEIQALKNLM